MVLQKGRTATLAFEMLLVDVFGNGFSVLVLLSCGGRCIRRLGHAIETTPCLQEQE